MAVNAAVVIVRNVLLFGNFGFKCNLATSRTIVTDDEPWFILTNIEPQQALREYSHRFGATQNRF